MPPPAKRRKVDPNDTQGDSQQIESLEGDLKHAIENSSSLNALADLLKEATKNKMQPRLRHKAIYALYRVFSLLISTNWYHSSSRPSQKNQVIRKWLVERLDQYLELLSSLLEHTELTIAVCIVYLLAFKVFD
jgi:U3 small nucleolar RNA-associated protein 19